MEVSNLNNKNDVREMVEVEVEGEASGVKLVSTRVVLERLPLVAAHTPSIERATRSRFYAQSGEESDTDTSVRSRMSVESAQTARSYLKRPRSVASGSESEFGSTSGVAAKIPVKGRGQGPLTHGKYVGIGKARKEVQDAKRAAEKAAAAADAERQIEELSQRVASRVPRVSRDPLDVQRMTAESIKERMEDALSAVRGIARFSKNLKGTSQKGLKDAAEVIAEMAEALYDRTASEESNRLRAENARLAAQLQEVKKEQEVMRAEMAKIRQQQPAPMEDRAESELAQLLRQELASLNTRFSTLEGRLLRPPLAASSAKPAAPQPSATQPAAPRAAPRTKTAYSAAVRTTAPSAEAAPARPPGPERAGPPPKGNTKKPAPAKKAAAVPAAPKKAAAEPAARKAPAEPQEWQTVGAKKKEKKKKRKANQAAKKKAAQLRAPRSAAVVITLQPAAVEAGATYAAILLQAKAAINPVELGIESGLRCKPTQTGARLLEIPGTTSGGKADALAGKLRELFTPEQVKVSRPVKCTSLRISGLDDSATADDVVAAIAGVGDCAPEDVKAGAIRRSPNGLGTVIVSCPVTAAKKIEGGRRLLIGWVSAQVKLLEARPTRCYRCLQPGHVGVRCSAAKDLSGSCFRCSQPGHIAASCEATPHCAICAAAGKPAEHRAGTKACGHSTATKTGEKRKRRKAAKSTAEKTKPAADVAQRQPASGGEVMDVN